MAQETFLQRLQKEWKAKQEATSSNFDTQPDPSYNPLELFKKKKEEDDKNPITKKHNVVRKYMV